MKPIHFRKDYAAYNGIEHSGYYSSPMSLENNLSGDYYPAAEVDALVEALKDIAEDSCGCCNAADYARQALNEK